ncbi:ImmA/IrrE family metallo-endopeptidase [Streptomyces sp. NPDC090093]|uniref:ImmA/IrrE family metallo-endopeptidase n=1 Tax=Streptomyces sp. NPDC090093 TaxID=3365945 RepID=UPI00380E05A7
MIKVIRRDIGLSGIQSLDDLIGLTSERRHKPITVSYIPITRRESAYCASSPDRDYIVVDSQANELTQLQAILHEIGHLLLGHRSRTDRTNGNDEGVMSLDIARALFPGLDPEHVRETLRMRSDDFTDEEERDVELLGTLLIERFVRLRTITEQGLVESMFAHRRSGV